MSLVSSNTYLGSFWTPVLCFGWIRAHSQKVPPDLVKIVIKYFQINMKDLPLSWYPIHKVAISTEYDFPEEPEDYPKKVEIDIMPRHITGKKFSCIVLGTIRSQVERYLNWRLSINRPKSCFRESIFHLGCISVPNTKNAERLIVETVKSIDNLGQANNHKIFSQLVENCELAETKSWWICHDMNQRNSCYQSTWNQEQKMQIGLDYLENEINFYGTIVASDLFIKRIGGAVDFKIKYETFTTTQTNMMIVIVPHCSCKTKHNPIHFYISRQPHPLTGHRSRLRLY